MIYNRHDLYVGRARAAYGGFCELEIDLFRQIVRPGQTVLDVGANFGTHTLWLAQAVGPAGLVYAFEPQRIVFQTLCANLALNGILNVRAYQAALGAQPGSITVPPLDYHRPNNFGGVSLDPRGVGEEVPLLTVDGLALDACQLMKIDVEGMEGDVLAGAEQTIRRLRPVLYVENDREEKSPELIARIQALDYRLWWHLPPLYNPNNFLGNREDVFPRILSVNVLCLPRETQANLTGFTENKRPDANWRQPEEG
jgi:FkbM family methyltransferase